MEHLILLSTDTATLAVFDPAVLAFRVSDRCDWWTDDLHLLPEVASGEVSLLSLSGDGFYKIRVTDGALTEAEAAYASELVILGLTVVSTEVFVGPGECLPGDGTSPVSTDPDEGRFFIPVATGRYLVHAHAIAWNDAPDWYVPEGQPIPANTPADVVLVLHPLLPGSLFTPPVSEPRIFSNFGKWLFPDLPRRLGPVPGMILTTTVVRRRDELVLKPCGPLGYRPILEDMAGLNWQDRVTVEVVAVNPQGQEFTALIKGRGAAA
jgi:hypothetical protein